MENLTKQQIIEFHAKSGFSYEDDICNFLNDNDSWKGCFSLKIRTVTAPSISVGDVDIITYLESNGFGSMPEILFAWQCKRAKTKTFCLEPVQDLKSTVT